MTSRDRSGVGVVAALLLLACAPRDAGFSDVRTIVDERVDYKVHWRRIDTDEDAGAVPKQVQALVARPLTVENATRIALLNNRQLQGALADLGLARAAVARAGLLPNPELEAEVTFPEQGGSANLDLGISLDLTEAVFLRGAYDAADEDLEATKLEAAGVVLDFAYQTKVAFYDYQGAAQQLELWRSMLDGAEAAYAAARLLYEAGNISDLAFANERALHEEAKLAVAQLQAGLLDHRERLNVLMGLWGDDLGWTIEGRLADPPERPVDVAKFRQEALANSLDLASIRHRLQAAAARVGVERGRGWLPELQAGVVAEREEGAWAFGPRVGLTLPVFDHGQGHVDRALAELDKLRENHAAIAIQLRSSIRRAQSRLQASRQRAIYIKRVLLPLKARIVHETQLQYNAMSIGVFQLLEARLDEVDAGRRYIDALRDYWLARASLDQLRAGRSVEPQVASAADAMTTRRGAGRH